MQNDGALALDAAASSLDAAPPLNVTISFDGSAFNTHVDGTSGDAGVLDVCRASKTWNFQSEQLSGPVTVHRMSDGFVAEPGAVSPGAAFLFLGEAQPSTVEVVLPDGEASLYTLPIGRDRTHAGALLIRHDVKADGVDTATAQSYLAGASAPGAQHLLGEIVYRDTMERAGASSLDGQRALFATGHQVVRSPVAFLMDSNGERVGNVLEFSGAGTGGLRSFACLRVTPTQHAAAFSVFDAEARRWRFQEVAADGAIVQEVSWLMDPPSSPSECPQVSPTPSGFVVAYARQDGLLSVLKIAATQIEARTVEALGHSVPRWLGETRSGGLLWLDRQLVSPAETRWPISLLSADGTWRTIDEDIGSQEPVAAEVGHLFLRRDAFSTKLAVEEIRCRGVQLAF